MKLSKLKRTLLLTSCACVAILICSRYQPCHCPDLNKCPILIWWTPFLTKTRVILCEDTYFCKLTTNRSYLHTASAQLFYGSSIKLTDLPLPRNDRVWAILHEESPKNLDFFLYKNGQDLFNITSTISRYSDMPLTLQYLKTIHELIDKKYYMTLHEKNALLTELAPVLYLQSSCDNPSDRDKIVTELMKFVKVDSYGSCLNNKKIPEELKKKEQFETQDEHLLKFQAKYKFIIAIENGICEDYITEKLWRTLILGSIPIYLGSPSIRDWLPNPKSAIIINEYKNIEEVAKTIININNNDTLYKEYVQHKLASQISNNRLLQQMSKGNYGVQSFMEDEHYIESFECFVCKAIHTDNIPRGKIKSVYDCPQPPTENKWYSHWILGMCKLKAWDYFVNNLKVNKFSDEEFSNYTISLFSHNNCDI